MNVDEVRAKADALLVQVAANTSLDESVALVVRDQRQTIIDLRAQLEAAGTDPVKLAELGAVMDAIAASDASGGATVAAVLEGTPAEPPA